VELITNDFCDVATNYVCEQLTTHAAQDTLPCPWSTVDIRAVLLSRPCSSSGYSLETTPAPNGPWTPSDAMPFMQEGQNSVVIPAENGQQFFRLHHR